MARTPSKQTPKQRASFARADRLRQQASHDRPAKTQAGAARKATPIAAKAKPRPIPQAAPPRKAAILRPVQERLANALRNQADRRQQQEQRTLERRSRAFRASFTHAADRRLDESRRVDHARRQAEIIKGVQRKAEWQKQQARKADERRRQDIRKEFQSKAEDRRQQAAKQARQQREAQLKEFARKAAAAIEAEHKRQREDQQKAHRRETDQVRNRHRHDMDGLRSNETQALEHHAGAIRRLDAAEQRELSELAVRHKSLTGRIAGIKPGTAQTRERETQAIRDRYEAGRMKTHRDLEALKERQFAHAQATRLQHARERLVSFYAHREGRETLQHRQEAERPRLIEGKQQAMVAAKEHEHVQERQQTHERAPVRALTPEFERAR